MVAHPPGNTTLHTYIHIGSCVGGGTADDRLTKKKKMRGRSALDSSFVHRYQKVGAPSKADAEAQPLDLTLVEAKAKDLKNEIERQLGDAKSSPDVHRAMLDALVGNNTLLDAIADEEEEASCVTWLCSGAPFWIVWLFACAVVFVGGFLYFSLQSEVDDEWAKYLGWPLAADAPDGADVGWWRFKNLSAGLMLGLTFGFLDNFGLFFGSENLDNLLYPMGFTFSAFALRGPSYTEPLTPKDVVLVHEFANNMMSGFGNTFSDVMGVVLGSAALEIAKAGMRVEPSFWVADIVSMMIGCLAGVLAPSIMKNSGDVFEWWLVLAAWLVVGHLAVGIGLSGVRDDTFTVAAVIVLGLAVVVALFVLLLIPLTLGGQYADRLRAVSARAPSYPLTVMPAQARSQYDLRSRQARRK